MTIRLSGLAYELGEHVADVAELPELAADDELRETLLEFGLRQYCRTDRAPLDLAAVSLRRTLDAGAIDPESVDAVIVATNSFWHPDFYTPDAVASLLDRLGLRRAYPIGLTYSYCGNAQTALRVASAMIKAGDAANILVVCADRAPDGETRMVTPNVSVSTDAAASCLVSARGDLEVLAIRQVTDVATGQIDLRSKFADYVQGIARGLRTATGAALAAADVTTADIAMVIGNNYNAWVNSSVGKMLGFERRRLYTANIGRFAHAVACDNLINLADAVAAGAVTAGDRLLLIGTGPSMWGATVVRHTGGGDVS